MTLPLSRSVALITGATSGIGLSLAEIFAQNDHDLFLVARDEGRLLLLSERLKKEFKINVEIIVQDLSKPEGPKKVFEHLTQRLSPKTSIDVLVNNAGFGIHGAFKDIPLQKEEDLINLQIHTLIHLTKLVIPGMIAVRKGHILNIASVYAGVPVPFQAVYGACKSFMISFSEALRAELEPFGIKITVVCPGVTRTEFRSRAGISEKSPTSGMSAKDVALVAFNGFKKGQDLVVPGAINKTFMKLIKWIPRSMAAKVMIKINRARGVNH